ncbi:MAG: flagellar biosynthetic protein FliO [Candidatus Gastranaerophilales bacterium]|nr:flagellar biosynthetic protein FliO [Candidatus Gastranaerophilales bacterium]
MGYISNFIVYFCAMIGIIILALYVYKKFNVTSFTGRRTSSLKIEDTLSLTPRKTLYVIRNGRERFLIAGDMERTTLISKLEENAEIHHETNPRMVRSGVDLSERAIKAQDNVAPIKKPIMKEIRNRLNF